MPTAPLSIFDVASHALSAEMVRMNASASNLANAGAVAGSAGAAYRALQPVFTTELDQASGLATVRVSAVRRATTAPTRIHDPGHPLADANGDVWTAAVDPDAEMVEMLDSSRQYQNLVEAVTTAKQLILDTVRMK